MKFEELTVGRVIHYVYEDNCCAAIVIAGSSRSYIRVRVLVADRGDVELTLGPTATTWHDPRGCKR